MKTGCRLLTAFLMMMVFAGLLPLAAHAEAPGTFSELQAEIDQTTSGTLTLEKDYQCEDGFSADGIDIKDSITIDLNGHTIDGNYKARIFFVNNEVTLTLEGPGTIKGGTAADDGGGIWVGANAALSLQNVEISGNTARGQGGGIWVGANATLSLENVEIWGNTAGGLGGGICAGNNATLSLQNVEISGNTARLQGGGIYADANAKLSLQNVEISGNTAGGQGGGVFLYSGAQGLEIGGETIVSDNSRTTSGGIAADNVYLYGPQLTVTSPLRGKAKIGLSPDSGTIRSYSGNENFKGMMPLGTGFNTHHPGADIEDFFVSDDRKICIGNRALNGYDMFCSEHTHKMECRTNRENEAELLYVCTKESCPKPSPFAKLTLVADNRPYNGKKYDDARLVDLEQFNRITGSNLVLSGENGTYLYYQRGEDTGFSWEPLEPGSYWAVFVGNGESSKKIKTQFQITRAPLTIRPETQTYVYNGETQGPGDIIYTDLAAAAAVVAAGLADGDRVTSVTIDGQGQEVGTYELEITGLRIENSKGDDVRAYYDITYETGSLAIKKPLTLGLTMDGWATGGSGTAPVSPVLTGNEGNGDVTYAYKPKGADDAAYSPDIPTAAGEYTVRATVKETEIYCGGEQTADFTISNFRLEGINLKVNKSEKNRLDCKMDLVWDAKPPYGWDAVSASSLKDIDGNPLPWDDEPTPGAIRYMETLVRTTEKDAEDFINLSGMKKEDIRIEQCSDVTVSVHEFRRYAEGGEVGEDEEVEGVWRIEVVFKVVQNEAPPTGITLDSENAKKEYFTGEALNVDGLVLTAQYSDGSTKTVDVTEDMVSGFDSQKPGKQTLTVTYAGQTAEYEVEVSEIAVTGITLDSKNAKTEYFTGEALDVRGLVLTAQYSDNSTKKITVTEGMVSGFDNKTPGKQTLTVTYGGHTAEYEAEVSEIAVTGITLDSKNAKTEYFTGETLDVSGLKLTASYSDGSTKKITVTEEMVSGFDNKTPGKQTLTVTYGGCTAEYEAEVSEIAVTGIRLGSDSAKKEYTEGDALDVSGLSLTAQYSDGSTKTVPVTKAMVSGFDSSKPGRQTLTVTYGGQTAEFEVEVKAKPDPKPDPKPTPEPESGSDDEPEPEPSRAPYYSVKDGAGNGASSLTWHKGSVQPLTVIVNRSENDSLTYKQFYCLMIDGKTVDETQYVASAGSLKLSIKPEFLETLRTGDHYTWIGFDDGSAALNIEIAAAGTNPAAAGMNSAVQAPGANPSQATAAQASAPNANTPNTKPLADTPQARTGDSSHPALYGSLMLAALAMLAALLYSRRYSKR